MQNGGGAVEKWCGKCCGNGAGGSLKKLNIALSFLQNYPKELQAMTPINNNYHFKTILTKRLKTTHSQQMNGEAKYS